LIGGCTDCVYLTHQAMKRCFAFSVLLVFLSCFAQKGLSQFAPDFEVTDIDGSSHALYADYLNNGHAVVLGFFYNGAPMVDELYPLLQEYAFAQWAANVPVNFLLLSHVDVNDALSVFAAGHNLVLPICGVEGGASEAIDGFIDGSFGPFYGYPMFVIVGPSGEVVYDPWASDTDEMISLIDAAIKLLLEGTGIAQEQVIAPNIYAASGSLHLKGIPCQDSAQLQLRFYDLSGRMVYESGLPCSEKVEITYPQWLANQSVIYAIEGRHSSFQGKVWLN